MAESIDETEIEKPFAVERATTGRAKCKKCKDSIDKDSIRIAKLVTNFFGGGKMKAWHHVNCLFEVFAKQRATTKRIEDPSEDIDGWDQLDDNDQKVILDQLQEFNEKSPQKEKRVASPMKAGPPAKVKKQSSPSTASTSNIKDKIVDVKKEVKNSTCRDNMFREFRRLCANIANTSSYTEKTAIVKKIFAQGSSGDGFKGDVVLWCKLLLPMANKRIYNLQSKQLIKLFARILCQDEDEMLEDLAKGDVAETIQIFFEKSKTATSNSKSLLTLKEVDEFLDNLSQLTKEDEQILHFKSIIAKCTSNDLKMIIRLIKHDLRMNCGPKHILEAIDPDAYEAFQVSNNLEKVLKRFVDKTERSKKRTSSSSNSSEKKVSLSLMTPVLPMLAEACTSVEMAMKKCPNGMLSEVKYDGERVQVHKQGNEFQYFSRSLKAVLPHKVNHLKEYIPQAFPDGDDLILDSEILMIDTKTGQPLPFGTLGVHKKAEFKDANVCIFIFDCIYYNGDVLINKTMKERRKILKQHMTIIPNRVMLSEVQEVHDSTDLAEMIAKVLKMGLEGLVLKDINSLYEPGKRHWLKIKKDYLFGGAMADSADLVVLGAWYGTGSKGGMKSVFLMGCYDEDRDKWLTVTKVHTGHDDATLAKLQDELDMIKISKDSKLVPDWLEVNKAMVPDFIAKDPKKQPVWEVTGAEFTNQGVHTADGISIRFPRVTRIRSDKDWATATSLKQLRKLFKKSSESIDFSLLLGTPSANTDIDKPKKDSTEHNSDEESITQPHKDAGLKATSCSEIDKGDEKRYMDVKKHQSKLDKQKECKIDIKKNEEENEPIENIDKEDEEEEEEAKTSAFFAFIDNDYIEYDSNGNPLNWIEGRKPKKGLPKNAKPLSELHNINSRSRGILGDVQAFLSYDLSEKKRKILSRTLITLGATVIQEGHANFGEVTHIIHNKNEISEDESRKYDTLSARHVNESWIESIVATWTKQDESEHAVCLRGIYCRCKCPHE